MAWTDRWSAFHARAFAVAGARDGQPLADFCQALDNAIAEGATLHDFRQDFDRVVRNDGAPATNVGASHNSGQ